MRPRFLACCVIAAGLTALAAACGDDTPVGPTGPSAVMQLLIEGPETLAPGQSAQYTATAIYLDGTRSPATDTQWSAFGGKLTVSGSGLAQASDAMGDSTLSASVPIGGTNRGRRFGYREVVIVPAGTFRVVGTIMEAGQTGVPITDAAVEFGGSAIRLATDFAGNYRAFGVPPATTLTVTREGYQTQTRTLNLTRHSTENFQMTLSGPRLGLSGDYTVVFEAGGACPGYPPLRDDLQRREYGASVTQAGAEVTVRLTEPGFLVREGRGDRFVGRADPSGVLFRLEDAYYYYFYTVNIYPNVLERLSDSSFLAVIGDAQTRGSDSALSGTLTGQMRHLRPGFPSAYAVQGCAQTQRISLNRR
jgi:hypothetical protein